MAASDRILVVGADGAIGSGLIASLRGKGHDVVETSRRGRPGVERLDLAAEASSWPMPSGIGTAYLCAAITSTAECRERPEAARAVNVEGTVTLARRLVAAGCRVVFPSTNMVFDGTRAFAPRDLPTSPRTAYGRMKAEAERRLLELGVGVCIVRLAKVLGRRASLFEDWRTALCAGRPIEPLADMVIAPVSRVRAVDALQRAGTGAARGILQLSATADVSYADVARRLADMLVADPALVRPQSASAAGLRLEHVAQHTTLEVSAPEAALGITAPDPWQAIDEALAP